MFCCSFSHFTIVQLAIRKRGSLVRIREKSGVVEQVNSITFGAKSSGQLFASGGMSLMTWKLDFTRSCTPSGCTVVHYNNPIASVCVANRAASRLLMAEWTDIVIVHPDCRFVSLARMDGKRRTKTKAKNEEKLRSETVNKFSPALNVGKDPINCIPTDAVVMCCDISTCCNFCAVGYSSGHVVVFNLQSKIERLRVHTGSGRAITAICFDRLNRQILSGANSTALRTIPFRTKSQNQSQIDLGCGVCGQIQRHPYADLYAVPLSNGSVSIVKMSIASSKVSLTEVRVLRVRDALSTITQIRISKCGRFVLASYIHKAMVVYDISSGLSVCHVDVPIPVLSFDIMDDILVCAFRGEFELSLFALELVNSHPLEAVCPNASSSQLICICSNAHIAKRFNSLFTIHELLQAHQPEPAMAKKKDAPFFLPSIPTSSGFKLVVDDNSGCSDVCIPHKRTNNIFTENSDFLVKLLEIPGAGEGGSSLMSMLSQMSAVKMEYELDNLMRYCMLSMSKADNISEDTGEQLLLKFLDLLSEILDLKIDYDLAVMVLGRLAVKFSSDPFLSQNSNVMTRMSQVVASVRTVWQNVMKKVDNVLCTINYLKNDQL